MPLDLAILNERGEPDRQVPISRETHECLLLAIENGDFPQLHRMHEYWGEHVEYTRVEVSALVEELRRLHKLVSGAAKDSVRQLIELAELAKWSNLHLHALPD